jgi:Domain of unknown function (DUF4388)
MAFQGHISEHSLAKIFQFVQRGYRTGLLSITAAEVTVDPYYIWFQSGRIMAVARDLEHIGLLSMLKKRNLISAEHILDFHSQIAALEQPLGLQLHTATMLDVEQLRLLFHAQVIQPVCSLFKTDRGKFYFDEKVPAAWSEMTGMSITAAEAILLGLRALRDWSVFDHQLPVVKKSLKKLRSDLPAFKLDTQEIQVWELANGHNSLHQIAQETDLPLLTVQQVGLRLMMIDLVKEIDPESLDVPACVRPEILESKDAVSTSFNIFTTDITGFLRKRG